MKLNKHMVEKPWGRTDIPAAFGDMAGRRIGEIWFEGDHPEQLPILVKWLFTSEKLSIQVHPDDAQARSIGMASGKEECWFIVNAEPGAVLGIGTTKPLAKDELYAVCLSGEIETLMDWKPVKPGDFFYIPAGTVHAIGAGITLVEVQQYADITYRLYDYGRPRELHLEEGVAVALAKPYSDERSGNIAAGELDIDGPFFRIRHVTNSAQLVDLPSAVRLWVVPLSGEITVDGEAVGPGECMVIDDKNQISYAADVEFLAAW